MRCEYIKKYRHKLYMDLLLTGKLNKHLHDVEEECYVMLEQIVERMKQRDEVTETLKAENQMLWVAKMNGITMVAENIVLKEFVYV